jgi:glycerol-3-phosphate O-acyltransferase
MKNNEIVFDKQRDEEYTRLLSQRIVEEFHKNAEVLPSILIAFVAFNVLKNKFKSLDLYEFLRLADEELELDYEEFKEQVANIIKILKKMEAQGQLLLAPEFEKSVDKIVAIGLKNLGMYHSKRPLITNGEGNIFVQDLNLLYFYHNRLVGYNLEDYVG